MSTVSTDDFEESELPEAVKEVQNGSEKELGAGTLVNLFSRAFMNPMVKITIKGWPSEPNDPFHLHRDTLIRNSEYFRGCLSAGFKESQSFEVDLDLEHDYRAAFGYFIEFAYNGTYSVEDEVTTSHPVPFNEDEAHDLGIKCSNQALLHTWIYLLGEQLLSDGLKAIALAKLRTTLLAAYLYPHPSGAGRFQYPRSWSYWNDFANHRRYREFCQDKVTDYGVRVPCSTSISGADVAKMVGLVYENTPAPPSPDADHIELEGELWHIRRLVTRYCASCFEELRRSPEVVDLLYGNREIFDDMMGSLSNGRGLGMVPVI